MGEKTVFKHPFFKPVEYRFQHPATNVGFQRQTSFRWLCLCGPITYVFHPFHHPVPASKILVVVFTCTYHYVCNQGWTRKNHFITFVATRTLLGRIATKKRGKLLEGIWHRICAYSVARALMPSRRSCQVCLVGSGRPSLRYLRRGLLMTMAWCFGATCPLRASLVQASMITCLLASPTCCRSIRKIPFACWCTQTGRLKCLAGLKS